ncbi:MAG: cytochrome c biogenesis protein CcdA [Pyrinomonadaceae bacterium]
MMIRVILFIFITIPLGIAAQEPAKWTLSTDRPAATLKSGDSIQANLQANIEAGWKLYALEQPEGGPIATTIKVTEGLPFALGGKIVSPKPTVETDELFVGMDGKALETKYFKTSVVFSIPLKVTAETLGNSLTLDVRFQLCDETRCLPPKTVRVTGTGFETVRRAGELPIPSQTAVPEIQAPTNSNEQSRTDLWGFILLAMGAGALSLLTPCVFPMIPITVSYFTNHAGGSRAKSIRLATIYSLGIIATFTILGMLLAVFVGAAGIQVFSASPWVNILITGIFLFFAFNLLGAYEISMPTSVLTKLDGLTRSKEGEGSGIVGALLMGLTFTLTSFTCTSPFIGSIMVSSAQGNWQMPFVGMLAFSTIFALPFFVLALAPQLISQLPRAGGWMNSIKVSMGFLEIAAAMKFLSNVDLIWDWQIFTRPVVLSVWIAVGILLAIYLLGKFQLFHDSKPERIGVVRLTSAIVSLAVSLYLLTGLFGEKLGTLESFLPPDLTRSTKLRSDQSNADPVWMENDYAGALARAKSQDRRVFVDFTGYTCTNCRWMEANIFVRREVEEELRKFVLVKLYTDREGQPYEGHQQLEQDLFGTVALPFYAVMEGDGTTIASFPGLTRNAPEFVDFLKKAQEN